MSNLARVNWLSQQRLDLPMLKAQQSYATADIRALSQFIAGTGRPLVLRGLEIIGKSGLTVTVSVANAFIVAPNDSVCPMFVAPSGEPSQTITLDPNSTSYVEAYFERVTKANSSISSGFYDETAENTDGLGLEFIESVASQEIVVLKVRAVLTPTADAVFIATITTGTQINNIVDGRYNLFRLGTGGSNPLQSNQFPWGTTRVDSPVSGPGVGQAVDSSFRSIDASGALNDKSITSLKDMFDALATRILEVSGGSRWFYPSSVSGFVNNLNLNIAYFDSDAGHSIVGSSTVDVMWSKPDISTGVPDLLLRTIGAVSGPSMEWQAAYGKIRWGLGGTFTSGSLRTYSTSNFVIPSAPADNFNVYLALEREVSKGSGLPVSWSPSVSTFQSPATKVVKGTVGDFSGIAIGDYIRKESQGISAYYQVVAAHDGTTQVTTDGLVLNASYVELLLDSDIHSSSVEPLKYWRQSYSQNDIVVETLVGRQFNQYADSKYYWIGRRDGQNFHFRGYGSMEPGEAVSIDADSEQDIRTHDNELRIVNTDPALIFDPISETTTAVALAAALSLQLRLDPDRIPTGGTTNIAVNQYEVSIPAFLTIADGQEIYARLSQVASATVYPVVEGTIASGAVNVWEVVSPTASPLKNKNNQNVFFVGKRVGNFLFLANDFTIGVNGRTWTSAKAQISETVFNGNAIYNQDGLVTIMGDTNRGSAFANGFKFVGAVSNKIRTVTTAVNITLNPNDYSVIIKNSAAIDVQMVNVAVVTAGHTVIIKDGLQNCSVNPITILPPSGTIEGLSSLVLDSDGESVTLVLDASGTNYSVV